MEILIWRHQTPAQKKLHKCTLHCRLTINGERAEIGSTNIEIDYDHFDTKRQEVTSENPDFVLLNLRLQEEYKTPILTYYMELLKAKEAITADAIKRRFKRTSQNNIGLMDAYELFLKDFAKKTKDKKNKRGKLVKAKRSESTLRPLNTCRNKVLEYLLARKEQHITILELDEDWFGNFREWLEDYPHEQSTVVKHLRTLRQVASFAKKKKLCASNPFEHCEVEKEEAKDPVFLNQKQFEFWCNFKFSSKMAQEVADVFVVYCRTGFHYTDLKQVITNYKQYLKDGLDDNQWLFKPREKTDVMAKVPVASFPEIKRIIDKYGGWDKLPIKQNHTMNAWLKICVAEINLHIGEELKIYEELSVKHGRCTISDWWINELGNKDDDLILILGRKTKEGLERYVRRDERSLIKALRNVG